MIVVDCSAIVDALVGPAPDPIIGRLAGEQLAAPSLLDIEIVSALRGLTLGDRISDHRALDALADYDQLTINRWDVVDEMRRGVFALGHAMSAYDAAYVVLAEALACPLVTRDKRLAEAAGETVEVVIV